MKILVVNLTRFGDLLQSQPIISGLADQGYEVGLACLEHFAPAAVLLSDLACVAPFPASALLREVEEDWSGSLSRLFLWRQEIYKVFKPDVVVNLTPSLSARMLTRYLSLGSINFSDNFGQGQSVAQVQGEGHLGALNGNAAPKNLKAENFIGFGVDEFGFGVNSSSWSTFLQSSSRMRGNSPYNLVDLFRKICNLGQVAPRYNLQAGLNKQADIKLYAEQKELAQQMQVAAQAASSSASTNPSAASTAASSSASSFASSFASSVADQPGNPSPRSEQAACNAQQHQGFVAFQLGASDDRRRWPVSYFAKLGSLFWKNFALMPVLVGSKDEKHLAEKYTAQAQSPFLNLIGATNLPGLAATLNQCSMLITNDTGTMHLAAGLNIPILALFLATAQPWDTAPYQIDVCCLEPDLPDHPRPFDDSCRPGCACRHLITPETVFELADLRLKSGTWEKPGAILGNGQARVWLTVREDKSVEPEGFLDLKSLSGHELALRTTWLRMQRYFLRRLLDNNLASIDKTRLPHNLAARYNYLEPEFLEAVKSELEQAVALLHLLCEQGTVLKHKPVEMIKNRFMGTWQRLQTLWDNSIHFNVLGLLWLAQTQEKGDDLQVVLDLAGQYKLLCQTWLELLVPSANSSFAS